MKEKTNRLTSTGRQTPHPATTRVAPEQIHRHGPRGHDQARVDVEHRARLVRVVSGSPAAAALHGHRHGRADGEGAHAVHGEDGVAGWAGAGGGGLIGGMGDEGRNGGACASCGVCPYN